MLTSPSRSITPRQGGDAAVRQPAMAGVSAPLGIYAKSPALLGASDYSPALARLERFSLQSAARYCLPKSRTAKCLRLRRRTVEGEYAGVSVWRHAEFQSAHYKGLQTCGSVWACPVCSAKISERRRIELAAAITIHKAAGGEVLLMTLTNRHDRRDDLGELIHGQAEALRRFMRGGLKASSRWFDSMGCIGTVRAMEVTHGDANGWHPHYHVLLFVRAGLDLANFASEGSKHWAKCCVNAGLKEPSIDRGLTLQGGDYAARYVGKWGLEQEMTKGHQKKARPGGATPFDLLRRVLADPKDKRAAALFIEFVQCFKGRRQLVWSKGLKARFAIEESTDEQLADGVVEGSELFARISLIQWRQILRFEKQGALMVRGQILELAGRNDRFGFDLLISSLVVRPERFPLRC